MKKITIKILIAVFTLSSLCGVQSFARANDDYKVIKKSSKEKVVKNEDVTWFKILVTDTKTKKVKVRVTIPIAIVDAVASACPDETFKIDGHNNINFKKILKELKKVGPMALIEVYEDDETVKIWLE